MINKEDKILIKNLWESKDYSAWRLIQEFPNGNWKRRGIEDLLKKLQETCLLDHCMGGGRRTSRSCNNISAVSFSQGSASTLLR